MTLQFTHSHEAIDPESLYGLLAKKGLLPDQFNDPVTLASVARGVGFGVIHDKSEVIATVLTFLVEPGILGTTLIKERGRHDQRREELAEVAPQLWAYWFQDPSIRRVDARHPVTHIQTGRVLDALGFKRETTHDGIRDGMMIKRFPTAIHIWGLLRLDVVSKLNDKMSLEEANAVE